MGKQSQSKVGIRYRGARRNNYCEGGRFRPGGKIHDKKNYFVGGRIKPGPKCRDFGKIHRGAGAGESWSLSPGQMTGRKRKSSFHLS